MQVHSATSCGTEKECNEKTHCFSSFLYGGVGRRSWLPAVPLLLICLGITGHPDLGAAAVEGASNNFFGEEAGLLNFGDLNGNSFFGGRAGKLTTTGTSNSFFGIETGSSNESGEYNSFFGAYSGLYTTGGYNSFFGGDAGRSNTSGVYNSSFGYAAGQFIDTGAGHSSFGAIAGISDENGNYNTFIGCNADLDTNAAPLVNATAIGADAFVARSDSLVLGSIKGLNFAEADVNVGIGTPAPERQLHIKGANAVFRMDRPGDTAAFMLVRTSAAGAPLKTFVVGANASGTNNGELVVNDLGTAVSGAGIRRMTIKTNGAVQFTGTVTAAGYYTSSSLALKDNVRTFVNALDTVNRLRGVRFDWKESGQPAVGLIAEEVENVVPEVITRADNGTAAGVSYASLVGVLVEAVKEQQAAMQATKAAHQEKINAQQAKLERQEAQLIDQQAKLVALQSTVQRQELILAEYRETLSQQQEAMARIEAQVSGANYQDILAQQ